MLAIKGGDDGIPLYTYSYLCRQDRSMMLLELSKEIGFSPKCLKCGRDMVLKYSIDDNGDIWMNEDILHE